MGGSLAEVPDGTSALRAIWWSATRQEHGDGPFLDLS